MDSIKKNDEASKNMVCILVFIIIIYAYVQSLNNKILTLIQVYVALDTHII